MLRRPRVVANPLVRKIVAEHLVGKPQTHPCENIPEIVFTLKRLILKPSTRRFDNVFFTSLLVTHRAGKRGAKRFIGDSHPV
jgi:hypothetical protein